MATSRYSRTPRLDLGAQFGTTSSIRTIRAAIKEGRLPHKVMVIRGSERLDTLSGVIYGDARYWWVLAAASDVGWGLQLPVDTVIRVPELTAALNLVVG